MRDDERCVRRKNVNTPELIDQRLMVTVIMLSFKEVQEVIPSEEASTLQIRTVAFLTRTIHQSTNPSLK